MNEAIANEASPPLPPGVNPVSQAIIRIAGNSQDGIQALGGFLARLAGRSEQEVMTFMTIPSTISGGPSIFQVRMSSGEVLSAGDEADVLLAFYQHSYEGHMASLKQGGIVIYDSDHVEPKQEWKERYHHVAVPISGLTIEAIGGTTTNKGKNVYALGLIARMFDLNTAKLEQILTERFGGKDASVLNNALAAFQAGYNYSLGGVLDTFRFMDARKKARPQVVMTGNEALAYGFIAAGVRFGAGYPITPSTEIMELLRRELPKYGGTFVQCEDEIASMSMILGAGYAGRIGVTTTSGPGLSLKMEAVGWGVMAEIPAIVVDVQRGGPSTGLPTNVEQSDLHIACYGSHGDAPRVVLAPSNVRDCFLTALEAVDLAHRYHVPVIVLSDQAIATRIEAFEEPDLQQVCRQIPLDLTAVPENKPYDLAAPNGVSHRALPGTRILNGRYPVAPGLEHDEMGHPTGSPKLHMQMNAKRRRKLQALAATLPPPEVYGESQGNLLLVGWGSTQGPIREAVDHSRALGDSVSALHLRYINPLPPGLESVFARFQHVVVVEMNDEGLYGYGQLAGLLRARYGDARIRGLNKTDGLTFKVREILEHVRSDVAAGMRHL